MAVESRKSGTVEPVFLKRILTGIVLAVIIVTAVLSNELFFLFLLLVINQLALTEYKKLIQHWTPNLQTISIQLTGALLIITTWLICKRIIPVSISLVLTAIVPVFFSVELFRQKEDPFQNVALSLLALIWISVPISLFLLAAYLPLAAYEYQRLTVLGYFIILWMGDSGAYFCGKSFGKRKLFERISPHKTWEGSAGGFLFAWIAALLNFHFFGKLQLSQWLLLAVIINITGTFGDFTKSMLKRSAGVKDSGTILPGHGGILDRFDSLIGSAPFAFLYLYFYV